MKLTLADGKTVTIPKPPGGEGWVHATVIHGDSGAGDIHVYVRRDEHGGGAFTDFKDGNGLVKADTGEKTVRFNNRLWTEAEEQAHIERIRAE